MPNPVKSSVPPTTCDVAIIGAGPAGLATATELKRLGIDNLVVLERESQAGGIPRHCGHRPFGMREFRRILRGPDYAAALVRRAGQAGVQICLNTTVVQTLEQGKLVISTPAGAGELNAKIVVVATGVRETPRAPRFVSGQRPLGIVTTGAFQSMVYLKNKVPFRRPVIVGSELVSFSALLTARHASIKPRAMIESNNRISARSYMQWLPRLLAVPLHLDTRINEITGHDRVTGIHVTRANGDEEVINCDGVIFTGQFTPESSLMRMAHIKVDSNTGGPLVDQYGICSDPHYIATGNLLRPVETAGWSWQEGIQTAQIVARSLGHALPGCEGQISILVQSPVIKYVMPQIISLPFANHPMKHLQLRFHKHARGRLTVRSGSDVLWSRNMTATPERRVLIPLSIFAGRELAQTIEIDFEEY